MSRHERGRSWPRVTVSIEFFLGIDWFDYWAFGLDYQGERPEIQYQLFDYQVIWHYPLIISDMFMWKSLQLERLLTNQNKPVRESITLSHLSVAQMHSRPDESMKVDVRWICSEVLSVRYPTGKTLDGISDLSENCKSWDKHRTSKKRVEHPFFRGDSKKPNPIF